MATVLGISNPNHNSAAALVRDGEIVGAIDEGKLSRLKRDARFPAASINHLLTEHDVQELDHIAISGLDYPYPMRDFKQVIGQSAGFREGADTTLRFLYSLLSADSTLPSEQELADHAQRGVVELPPDTTTTYVDHHEAHAASAYFTSGFSRATVLTVDGGGDGLSSTVYAGEAGELSRVWANNRLDSIGRLWSRIPTVFGFKGGRHAGKFMGLAAYAEDPSADVRGQMRDLLVVDGMDIVNPFFRENDQLDDEAQISRLKLRLGEFTAPEVARALQERTQEVLSEFAEAAVLETGLGNVTLAGGVFANVKVNQQIFELPTVEKLFVHPDMRDSGLALGAALLRYSDLEGYEPRLLGDVFLGPRFDDEIRRTIERKGLRDRYSVTEYTSRESLAEEVATLLAEGKVVNLYTGRVEYGPRALGNRSTLYQPTDPSAIEWLNARLDRTEFMPFAPVTLKEHASECYVGYDPESCPAADFMTISFDCTEAMENRSPGVVHVDGTARPQVIDRETHPLYYDILDAYFQRTGIPSLINTSFNMHGEPIVCTPSQAVKSFEDSRTDALVVGNWLVVNA